MDMAVFAIATIATPQSGHVQQHLHTPIRPTDVAVFGIAATATHGDGHFEQHLDTPLRSKDMAVSVPEPIARHANGLLQQPLGKHHADHYPNINLGIETTGGIPNLHTSQLIDIRLS